MATSYDHRLFDPDTAIRAAIQNYPKRETHRFIALDLLARDSLTDFELAERAHIQPTSIGKRRKELEQAGFVEYAGFNRPSPTGSAAMVWRITSAGFAFWNAERKSTA